MKTGKILTSIEDIIKYLNKVNIKCTSTYKRKVLQPQKYSDEYYHTFHDGDYKKTFLVASEKRDYDIMLEDGSLFQFTACSESDIHYSFLHRIETNMSFEEFYELYGTDDNMDIIEQEYEYYLSSDKNELSACPIRYDVAKTEYTEMHHSYAHLHIGIDTDIRIPSDKIMSPLYFVDFIIKHMYKEKWDNAYKSDDTFKLLVESLKAQTEPIDELFFTEKEKKLLYLV